MKLIFKISLFILLFTQATSAQNISNKSNNDSTIILVGSYEGDIADAAIDNLDNLYIVSSTGQIKKYNAAGDSIGVYNQVKNFGRLFSIDVSNPLKLLLFL